MKVAFAYWENRIAPVFDSAHQIYVVEVESGRVLDQTREVLAEPGLQKALGLTELGIETLVCGAISRPMHGLISAYGIQVVPFIAGDLQEVIEAWRTARLEDEAFAMPGCCGGRSRWFKGKQSLYPEVTTMNRRGVGRGASGGRGPGRGGQGFGHLGGGMASESAGACFCPQCGQRVPHERGTPCVERKCPSCGAVMTRP